jgi:CheY-like chemotaxis protein
MEPERTIRVLYVDDEPLNLRLMQDVFRLVLKRPDQLTTVESGLEALNLLQSQPFDVVVSDQRMPGICGTALLARAKEISPRIARVILTGFPSDKEVQEALRYGVAEAVLPKPWKPRELEQTILEVLSRREGAVEGA